MELARFSLVIAERNQLFLSQLNQITRQFIQWHPACWCGFLELNSIIHEEEQAMWGQVGARPRSDTERQQEASQLAKDIQGYCDRMAGILRGLAQQAGHSFPELANEFALVADDAAGILERYKIALGSGLSEETRKIESALAE
jgi:hypothetical protein